MARDIIAYRSDVPGDEAKIRELLTLPSIRMQYESGAKESALIAPDGWTLDQHFLDWPGRKQIQVDLAFDYHTNVELYPRWQAWLRKHRPPTLITWGRGDPIFLEPGARAICATPRTPSCTFSRRAISPSRNAFPKLPL